MNISDGNFFNANNKVLAQKRFKDISSLVNQKETKILGASTQDKEVYKIAVIGDSVTYGLGVQDKEKYTNILEMELNKLYKDKKFEVYNFSLVGDDQLDNYMKYLLASKNNSYDLHIFAYVTNDIFIEKNIKYPNKKEEYEKIYQDCYIQTSQAKTETKPDENSQSEYNKFLFYESVNSTNVCMTNFILSSISKEDVIFFATDGIGDLDLYKKPENNFDKDDYYTLALANYSKLIRENGFKILSPYDNNSLFPTEKGNISGKENHPNKTIHKLFAYFLTQEIIKIQSNNSENLISNEKSILCDYEKKIAKDVSILVKEDIYPIKYCE